MEKNMKTASSKADVGIITESLLVAMGCEYSKYGTGFRHIAVWKTTQTSQYDFHLLEILPWQGGGWQFGRGNEPAFLGSEVSVVVRTVPELMRCIYLQGYQQGDRDRVSAIRQAFRMED